MPNRRYTCAVSDTLKRAIDDLVQEERHEEASHLLINSYRARLATELGALRFRDPRVDIGVVFDVAIMMLPRELASVRVPGRELFALALRFARQAATNLQRASPDVVDEVLKATGAAAPRHYIEHTLRGLMTRGSAPQSVELGSWRSPNPARPSERWELDERSTRAPDDHGFERDGHEIDEKMAVISSALSASSDLARDLNRQILQSAVDVGAFADWLIELRKGAA